MIDIRTKILKQIKRLKINVHIRLKDITSLIILSLTLSAKFF
jgi:hypothetical protein